MRLKLYCDLYVSECWQKKMSKIIHKLRSRRLQPQVYVIALSQGEQNHLEFYSSALLKQRCFDDLDVFVVGIADGYDECLMITGQITEKVYKETGSVDIRSYILKRQNEYERAGGD